MITHYDDEEDELNACGCPIPNDKRKPAGCIQVEDVQTRSSAVAGLYPVCRLHTSFAFWGEIYRLETSVVWQKRNFILP